MTEVIPNLFIGNWKDAELHANELYVITVAGDSPFIGNEHFKLNDGPGNPPGLLESAADSVHKAYSNGKKILIHCHGGRSRSAAVTVLSIMKILNKNLCEAYDLAKDKHDITRIHPYLSKILLEIEEVR